MKRLVTLVVAVASVGTFAAIGMAQSALEAPRNTALPTIAGSAIRGGTLTASPGTWTADPAPTFTYRWQRCNLNGLGCLNLAGQTAQTYTVRQADVGRRLRVVVTARNSVGAAAARSEATAVVTTAPVGSTPLPGGGTSIPVTSVAPPQRLIISRVEFTPNPVRSRTTPVSIRVLVTDTRGYVVRDALVFVRSTPLVTTTPAEGTTGADGWATFSVQPTSAFPLRRGYNVQFFVRARKAGENVLAGVSTRRLVQVRTAPAS